MLIAFTSLALAMLRRKSFIKVMRVGRTTHKKVAKNNYKKLPFQSISLKFLHYNVE